MTDTSTLEAQSKWKSFCEQLVNQVIGYTVALIAQIIVFPMFGITTSFQENAQIAFIFMIISIIRGYLVRRLFNGR